MKKNNKILKSFLLVIVIILSTIIVFSLVLIGLEMNSFTLSANEKFSHGSGYMYGVYLFNLQW